MDQVPGSTGTSAGFALRLGQTIFASASLLFMSFGVQFYSYTSFCFLVTIMGLVIPWSFILALIDGYSVLVTSPIRRKGLLLIIVVGDWVKLIIPKDSIHLTCVAVNHKHLMLMVSCSVGWKQLLSTLALGAACAAAAVVDVLLTAGELVCVPKICSRYLVSTVFAFLSWFLCMGSSLFNMWILPSL